jgi:hypothetical protein
LTPWSEFSVELILITSLLGQSVNGGVADFSTEATWLNDVNEASFNQSLERSRRSIFGDIHSQPDVTGRCKYLSIIFTVVLHFESQIAASLGGA